MKSKILTAESKVIYAYLCTYAGKEWTAYPSESMMTNDLGMGKNRFYKHLKLLIDNKFISVNKIKHKGKFKNNVYTINIETEPRIDFADMENADMQNEYTIIPSIKDTSIKSIVFKEEEIKKEKQEKKEDDFLVKYFKFGTPYFDIKEYTEYYNSLSNEEINKKGINAPYLVSIFNDNIIKELITN